MRKLLLLLLLILSCTKTPPQSRPGTRIVSLAPSITEILFAIGAGNAVVGVTTYCDHPAAVAKIAKIGSYEDPDVERILALKPTLVIGTSISSHKRVLEVLAERGVRVLCVPESGLEGVLVAIKRVGQATGFERQAENLVKTVEEAIEKARLGCRGKKRLRVLLLVGHEPFVAAAAGTLPADLLQVTGAVPLPEKARGYIKVSLERIAAEKPDLVLDASMGSEQKRSDAVLQQLARVIPDIKKRYVVLDPDIFCRSGPRVVVAIHRLMEVFKKWR